MWTYRLEDQIQDHYYLCTVRPAMLMATLYVYPTPLPHDAAQTPKPAVYTLCRPEKLCGILVSCRKSTSSRKKKQPRGAP